MHVARPLLQMPRPDYIESKSCVKLLFAMDILSLSTLGKLINRKNLWMDWKEGFRYTISSIGITSEPWLTKMRLIGQRDAGKCFGEKEIYFGLYSPGMHAC